MQADAKRTAHKSRPGCSHDGDKSRSCRWFGKLLARGGRDGPESSHPTLYHHSLSAKHTKIGKNPHETGQSVVAAPHYSSDFLFIFSYFPFHFFHFISCKKLSSQGNLQSTNAWLSIIVFFWIFPYFFLAMKISNGKNGTSQHGDKRERQGGGIKKGGRE